MNLLALLSLLVCLSTPSQEWVLEDLRLLAVSPEHSRAVVWVPGHGKTLVHAGEELPGRQVALVAVLEEKLVVEEVVQAQGRRLRIRAWIESSGGSRGEVRIRRMQEWPDEEEPQQRPMTRAIELDLPGHPEQEQLSSSTKEQP